ncbi:MAG: LysR family transcriptional regulator [Pseudomonadota bacterium]
MNLWTEIHTALSVGRTGTVRGAADSLGIHRATVSRHIDMLEERLGTKLFIRHPNGYTPTEMGRAIIQAGEQADAAISVFMGHVDRSCQDLTGVITLSAVARAGSVIRPAVKTFCEAHPGVTVRFEQTVDLPRLELGEAHIAVTEGAKPAHPDYVVIPFFEFQLGLFAHRDYIERFGYPDTIGALSKHKFVGSRRVYYDVDATGQLGDYMTADRLVLESHSPSITLDGILSGLGIGLAARTEAARHTELMEMYVLDKPLMAPVWISTHVDMHRTRAVSEFLRCLKHARPKPNVSSRRPRSTSLNRARRPTGLRAQTVS